MPGFVYFFICTSNLVQAHLFRENKKVSQHSTPFLTSLVPSALTPISDWLIAVVQKFP